MIPLRTREVNETISDDPKSNDVLKLISLNIQSIVAKKGLLSDLIDDYNPDIIAISETWLPSDIISSEFFPKGFNIRI